MVCGSRIFLGVLGNHCMMERLFEMKRMGLLTTVFEAHLSRYLYSSRCYSLCS